MKLRIALPLIVGGWLWAAGACQAGGEAVKTVFLLSPEIDCPACEDGIKHLLVTTRGVKSAEVDVLTNKVTVRYDPALIKPAALIGRIGVMGYTAKESK